MKIFAPVKDFNGLRNNVRFVRGVGETNDPTVAEWFRNNGYKVSIEERPRVEQAATVQSEDLLTRIVEETEPVTQPDFDSMTPNDLRDWMKENGFGDKIKNTRNKEKLLQIIRG